MVPMVVFWSTLLFVAVGLVLLFVSAAAAGAPGGCGGG